MTEEERERIQIIVRECVREGQGALIELIAMLIEEDGVKLANKIRSMRGRENDT